MVQADGTILCVVQRFMRCRRIMLFYVLYRDPCGAGGWYYSMCHTGIHVVQVGDTILCVMQ